MMAESQDNFVKTCGLCGRGLAGPVNFCPYCGKPHAKESAPIIPSILSGTIHSDADATEDQRTIEPIKVVESPPVILIKPQPLEKNLDTADDFDKVTSFSTAQHIEKSSPFQEPITPPTANSSNIETSAPPINQPSIKSVSTPARLYTAGVVVLIVLIIGWYTFQSSKKQMSVPPAAHTTTSDKTGAKKTAASKKTADEKTKKAAAKKAESQRSANKMATQENRLPVPTNTPQVKEGKRAADEACGELNIKLSIGKELSAKERGFYVDECK